MYCAHHIRKRSELDMRQEPELKEISQEQPEKSFSHNMFMDESVSAFFRRPAWSTDGKFLFLPTGVYKKDKTSEPFYVTYVFNRSYLQSPIAFIPTKKPSLIVKFSPQFYKLRENVSSKPFLPVGYRMIFAVASSRSVTVYETQRLHPIAHFENLHYATHTDLSWSSDGSVLAISSMDGYVSLIKFDDHGELLPQSEVAEIIKPITEGLSLNKEDLNTNSNTVEEKTVQTKDELEPTIFSPQIKRITPTLIKDD